jgi:hypothetical protein
MGIAGHEKDISLLTRSDNHLFYLAGGYVHPLKTLTITPFSYRI